MAKKFTKIKLMDPGGFKSGEGVILTKFNAKGSSGMILNVRLTPYENC